MKTAIISVLSATIIKGQNLINKQVPPFFV